MRRPARRGCAPRRAGNRPVRLCVRVLRPSCMRPCACSARAPSRYRRSSAASCCRPRRPQRSQGGRVAPVLAALDLVVQRRLILRIQFDLTALDPGLPGRIRQQAARGTAPRWPAPCRRAPRPPARRRPARPGVRVHTHRQSRPARVPAVAAAGGLEPAVQRAAFQRRQAAQPVHHGAQRGFGVGGVPPELRGQFGVGHRAGAVEQQILQYLLQFADCAMPCKAGRPSMQTEKPPSMRISIFWLRHKRLLSLISDLFTRFIQLI